MAPEWMSDQWKKKFSQTEYYTYTKVKLQIDGEMLVHLIVNDVAHNSYRILVEFGVPCG